MGYYNDLSIDTRTCGEADEDTMLDRRDGIAQPFTYYRCPECGRNDSPTSNLIPWMCVDCERRVTRKVKARACPFCSQPSHARACPELRAALFADDDCAPFTRKPGPFASLRDMVYTECPCGCGFKGVCEAQLERARTHDAELEF